MSFSQEVKNELIHILPREDHCMRAELAAFLYAGSELPIEERLSGKSCCMRSFLRGAFLSVGSVTDPGKSYHLEMVFGCESTALMVKSFLSGFEIEAKNVVRNGKYVIYLKEGDDISAFLALVQAQKSVLDMESIRVVKDVRNHVNRKVNCEAANIQKTVEAVRKQLRDIEIIEKERGLKSLSDPLRTMAEIRKLYPEDTLQELGNRFDPPVGKSGVNHRLRRLHEIAEEVLR